MFFGKKMSMMEKEKELKSIRSERVAAERSRNLDVSIASEKAKLRSAKEGRLSRTLKVMARKAKDKRSKSKGKRGKGFGGKFNQTLFGDSSDTQSIFTGMSGSGKRKGKRERNLWTDW